MTTETRMATELRLNAKRLRGKAQEVEQQWRTAHGIDAKLRRKRKPKQAARVLERKETARREQRKQDRTEREALRVPLVKGVVADEQPAPKRRRTSTPKLVAQAWGRYRHRQLGKMGAASAVRRIDPVTGEVIGSR